MQQGRYDGLTMYSVGATNSTTDSFSSLRFHRSAGMFLTWSQSKSCGTSFERLHMQHFHRCPPSINVTNGLMYVRHRRHLAITVSDTTGTGSYKQRNANQQQSVSPKFVPGSDVRRSDKVER